MLFCVAFLMETSFSLSAQDTVPDTAHTGCKSDTVYSARDSGLNYKRLIIPAVFISYGIAGLSVKALKQLNFSTRDEVVEDRPAQNHLDNYTQYLPAAMVYGFNAIGVRGAHDFRDRTIIYVTSQLLSASMVLPLKYLVGERRPDGSNNQSFPSGHTATAFSSAQFMFREYRDSNFWLSLCGYPVAIFTGIYRVINNKHYVGDVVAGAGFGILSTELAYWLYPKINALLGHGKHATRAMIAPSIRQGSYAVAFVRYF
jgi:membrane-associated phospholipid phosphatase